MSCCWTSINGVRKVPLIELLHHLGGHRFHPPDFCIVSQAAMALWRNKHLITGCFSTQRSGLNFHPLGVSCWCVVCEAANFPLSVVVQPADTFLWSMAVNKRLVLVLHHATLAKPEPCWLIESLKSCSIGGKWGTVQPKIKLRIYGLERMVLMANLFLAILSLWVLYFFISTISGNKTII